MLCGASVAVLQTFEVGGVERGKLQAAAKILVADALTHIGQIGMLRRLANAPVKGENYYAAEIETGRVGADQAAPKREF